MAAVVAAAMLSVIYPASAAVITGKVVDASTDEPMEFVNVTVSDKSSGRELPVGTMSGVDGAFKLSGVPSGSYNVKLSFVGYKPALVDALSRCCGAWRGFPCPRRDRGGGHEVADAL